MSLGLVPRDSDGRPRLEDLRQSEQLRQKNRHHVCGERARQIAL